MRSFVRMRVWKSVGAVAVYNRRLAAITLVATILALFGGGLILGLALAGDGTDSGDASAATPKPTTAASKSDEPAPSPTTPAPAPDADALKKARDRAYARGYKDGTLTVFPKDGDFKSGGAYMIRLKRGKGGALVVGPNLTVVEGREYFLCGGGSRLCIRTPR